MKRKDALKLVLKIMKEKGIRLTKINIQKIVFFLKEFNNIPVYYNYEVYLYGPYSSELQDELDDMAFWDEIKKKNRAEYDIIDSDFKVNSNEEIENSIRENISKFGKIIDNNFSFDNVEIAGTLLYCIAALKNFDIEPNKENVIEEFKQWKGNKYPETKVREIYNKLKERIKI